MILLQCTLNPKLTKKVSSVSSVNNVIIVQINKYVR